MMMDFLCSLCGGAPSTAQAKEEGVRCWPQHPLLQRYRLIKQLGEGGFSEVHVAECLETGKQVALKVVFLGRRDLSGEQRAILASEAKFLRMVNHPNVIRCLEIVDVGRGAAAVIVMEALGGGEVLRQLGAMEAYSEEVAARVFAQVMSGVAYLHSLGLMHRDIKPENVKLIDLGMAGVYRPRAPQRGCMGSPGFIAPEVVRGAPHSPAMDVYSCGVLLFVMLVGRKPWDADDSASLQYAVRRRDEAPGLRDARFAALSKDAQQLLAWMLSDLARERPTAAQVLEHPWLQRDPTGARARRLLSRAVQKRMGALADSRRLLGTRRAMLLMHAGSGKDAAAAFHRAVTEAKRLMDEAAAARSAQQQQQQNQLQQNQQGGPIVGETGLMAAAEEVCRSQQREERDQPQACVSKYDVAAAAIASPAADSAGIPPAASALPQPTSPGQQRLAPQQQQQQQHGATASVAAPSRQLAATALTDGPQRKKQKGGAQPSALAAAIAGCGSQASLAELAARSDASLTDLARVSLARQSRIAPAAPSNAGALAGGGGGGGDSFLFPAVGADAAATGGAKRAVRQPGPATAAAAAPGGSVTSVPTGESGSRPVTSEGDPSALLLPLALERGISLPAAMMNRSSGGGGGRSGRWFEVRRARAVSYSPGALELLAAADAAQQIDIIHGRTTTEDDATSLGASTQLMGATLPGLGALGLGTPGTGGGARAAWSPRAAAQELLASFRRRAPTRSSSVRRSFQRARLLNTQLSATQRLSGASAGAAVGSLGAAGGRKSDLGGALFSAAAGRLLRHSRSGGEMAFVGGPAGYPRSSSSGREPLLAAHDAASAAARSPPGGGPVFRASTAAANSSALTSPPNQQPHLQQQQQQPQQLEEQQQQQQHQASLDLDLLLYLDAQDSTALQRSTSGAARTAQPAAAASSATPPAPQQSKLPSASARKQMVASAFATGQQGPQPQHSQTAAAAPVPLGQQHHARQRAPSLDTAPSDEGWGLPSGLLSAPLWLQQPDGSASGQPARLELQGFVPPLQCTASGTTTAEVTPSGLAQVDEGGSSAEDEEAQAARRASAGSCGSEACAVVDAASAQAAAEQPEAAMAFGTGIEGRGPAGGASQGGGAPDSPRHGRSPSHVDHWLQPGWAQEALLGPPPGPQEVPGWLEGIREGAVADTRRPPAPAAASAVAVPPAHRRVGSSGRPAAAHPPSGGSSGSSGVGFYVGALLTGGEEGLQQQEEADDSEERVGGAARDGAPALQRMRGSLLVAAQRVPGGGKNPGRGPAAGRRAGSASAIATRPPGAAANAAATHGETPATGTPHAAAVAWLRSDGTGPAVGKRGGDAGGAPAAAGRHGSFVVTPSVTAAGAGVFREDPATGGDGSAGWFDPDSFDGPSALLL